MTDITLAIGTCDLYLKFVPNCIYLANKYLEPDIERLIIGETEHLDIKNYKFINSGKLDWGQRMINGLNSVKTKYVFFILEDYYLSQKLTKEYFDWMIKFMNRERAKKLIITSVPDWAGYKYSVNIDTIKKRNTTEYIKVIIAFLNLLNLTNLLSSRSDISLLPTTL